jgi:multidrug efflux pump subunit AcrA (membrane-fusion protein)
MDSYKNQVFEAEVVKIFPLMNDRSKTFTAQAIFKNTPKVLYPNLTVEANIVIQTKNNVLTLPLSLINDSNYVTLKSGQKVQIKTGVKDYQKVEILEGIGMEDELLVP